MPRRAAIDLGSNSALLTVVDGAAVLHDEARVVGLGKGLIDGGGFRSDRMQAALAALNDYADTARSFGIEPASIAAIATSASRRAVNAGAFYADVEARTGIRFRIIPGAEEAELTFRGARSGQTGLVAVIDMGGGSTEIAIGDTALQWNRSFEVGTVRLTEQVLGEQVRIATPEDLVTMQGLLAFEVPLQAPAVGVAGSVTTLAAAVLGLTAWDAARVQGAVLTDAHLAWFQQALVGRDAAARRELFAVGSERADHLLAGATILRAALAALGQDRLTVSTRGLRFGVLEPLA